MENKIPVPTDNIFKFYALFGLLLFTFAIGASLYVNNATNELIIHGAPEIAFLQQIEKPSKSETVKLQMLEKKIQIAIDDRKGVTIVVAILLFIGLMGMLYGFTRWHRYIQPGIDETAKVQLEIAKLQLEKLRRELASVPIPPDTTAAKNPAVTDA